MYTRPNVTDLSSSSETQGQFQNNATNLVGYYNQAHQLWTSSTAYVLGNIVKSSALPNLVFECSASGTTGSSEPAWPTAEGQTVVDGSVTWTARRQGSGGPMLQALYNAPPQTVTSVGGVLSIPASTNYIIANGSEAITSIAGSSGPPAIHPAGSLIQIRWNTLRTLTNGASLLLQDGVNRTTHIGDVGDYQFEAGGVVREVGYFPVTTPTYGGAPGLNNYIVPNTDGTYPRKMTPNGMGVDLSAGTTFINATQQNRTLNTVTLPARQAALVYDTSAGTSGYVAAAFPAADNGTVNRWIIDGSATINSTVGTNALTKTGTVTQVDGWIGYGGKGDGSTGYYQSASAPSFLSTATTPYEMQSVFSVNVLGTKNAIFIIGPNVSCTPAIFQLANNNIGIAGSIDTGFTLELGKTYNVNVQFDGVNFTVFVNGVQVYKAAGTSAITNTGYCYIHSDVNSGARLYGNTTVHYAEIRNTLRTPAQIAAISNALLLPCRYTGYSGAYPTVASGDLATYHEWRFAETSGANVADAQTTSPLTGTATGTTIVANDVISGVKARSLAGTDQISIGNLTWPSTAFTVIAVLTPASFPDYSAIISNRNSGAGAGGLLGVRATGTLVWRNWATDQYTGSVLLAGKPNFIGFVVNNGVATEYVNSPLQTGTGSGITIPSNNLAGFIGKDYTGGTLPATFDYLVLIPRALSQAEIAQYYNALMKQGDRTIINDVVPANSIAVGFAQTSSSGVIAIDDASYKYGRREGATGGNRKVFLGWIYLTNNTNFSFPNPFAFEKMKYLRLVYKANLSDSTEVDAGRWEAYYQSGWTPKVNQQSIQFKGGNASKLLYDMGAGPAWITSGYIGCYAEVIE
ncbi:MAG: hypothetical protein P4N59_11390 [Negativicutes bacterium]|nr:hypothetical protein [Negativicutes bacterium]